MSRRSIDSWLTSDGHRRLVTCSALLDVLTTAEIDAVCGAVINNQVPVLFSLTVTGALSLTPADPRDQLLLDAFNDHQRRAGRAGPDAASLAVSALLAGGMTVRMQDTPWLLTASDGQSFVARMLQERLEAAVAHEPALARTAAAWFELRRVQLGARSAADRAGAQRHPRPAGRTVDRYATRRSRTRCRCRGPC